MTDALFLFLGGMIILFLGSNILIKGSIRLARRIKVSEFFISMVLIGFGTSISDLIVSIYASTNNFPDLSIGNVIGSNIIEVLLLVGLAGLIHPIIFNQPKHKTDFLFTFLSLSLLSVFVYLGEISSAGGLALIFIFLIYLGTEYCFIKDKEMVAVKEEEYIFMSYKYIFLYIILGLILSVIGSIIFIKGVMEFTKILEISKGLMGLLIIAPATALPDLSITILASIKKKSQVVLGNIIGSVLINTTIVVGSGALITPAIIQESHFQTIDIWIMLISFIMLYFTATLFKKLTRFMGCFYLFCFCIYLSLFFF